MLQRALSRRLPVLLAAATLAACAGAAGPPRDPGTERPPALVVHYFNDWHGHLEPFRRPGEPLALGGAARLARLLADRRAEAAAEGADTLLFVAGDVLQGTPMSTAFRGEPDFALLERLGVDAMSLGNHELDFGQQTLHERIAQVRFPILAANARRADGTLLAGDAIQLVTPRQGLRVAVLGLVTADTGVTTHPRNVIGLTFDDPVATARRYLPRLAAASDLVVVVSHCGTAVERRIAALRGVDLVVGGHDQRLLDPPRWVGRVPVVQAFEWGEYLGEARFARAGRAAAPAWAGNRYLRVTEALPEDPAVAAFVAGYRARLSGELARVVTTAAVLLDGAAARDEETNLGNLVADALRQASGAEVALINGGAIRGSIEPGPVTLEQLMTVLPFENRLVVVALTGAELSAMIERSLRVGGGAFLQISGLRLRAEQSRVLEATVGDEPLDPHRLYQVATSDFLAAGGDGYREALGKPLRDTGYGLLDAVLRWVELQPQPLRPEEDGRLALAVASRPAA